MNGIILVNKPKGMSSFHVVHKIRKLAKIKKVGHAGTLDPEACGLLVVCLGKACKLSSSLTAQNKVYETTFTIGLSTTTDDMEGEIIYQKGIEHITESKIRDELKKFVGKIMQIPPNFSAIKINGKRAYKLARENKDFLIPPREVEIFDLEILKISFPHIYLKISCSKGTYIRSIARDLGEVLKVGGITKDIKRLASGNFNLNNAVDLNQLDQVNIEKYLIKEI